MLSLVIMDNIIGGASILQLKEMSSKTNYKVYMDIQIGATAAGRIIFEIFNDLTPKTSENFRALCTGEYGKVNNQKLHYLGTKVHRIKDGFVLQAGDISNLNGKGGYSIYGRTFVDENFARTHSCAGMLSMANSGRNTNASQFFITLKACPHLDGKHVVFGQVIDGMEVVRKIAKVPVDKEDKPRYPILIIDSGELDDFRGFLRYDPFKKQVWQEIRQARERIIRDQHAIRKLLNQGLDPNDAYSYKKRLEACEKNLAELDRKEEQMKFQRENQGAEEPQEAEKSEEPLEKSEVLNKLRAKIGEERVSQFLDLKLKINEAQVANNKAALDEDIRENDVNYHKMIKKNNWLKKRKEEEEEIQAKGINKDKLYMNRNALRKEEEGERVDQSFGWNVYGDEATYKAYDKRCEKMEKQKQQGDERQTEDALNRLQQDIIRQQEKRTSFSRRRIHDEDEKVTYINDRNRIYNQKLERNFGTFASQIKTGLEMNNKK